MRSIVLFVIWLACANLALAIVASIVALLIAVGESRLSTESAAYMPWVGMLIGGFAGYQAGVRAYRLGKRWAYAKWPVASTPASNAGEASGTGPAGAAGSAANNSTGFSVTNRQRQLIVLSAAIVLLLGPIVIMGNCSGFNEGSMKVGACAVDFPLARALADLLWGIALLSAFIVGLPILAYIAACVALLKWMARRLRNAIAAPGAGASEAGSPGLTLAAATPMVVIVGAFLLQIGAAVMAGSAASSAFDEHCRTAGEQLHAAPVGPVQSVYYEANAQLHTDSGYEGFGSEIARMIGRGWIRSAETSELESRTNTPTGKKIRHELYTPYAGRAVDQFASQYGVFTKVLAGATGDKSGIEGTEIAVKDLKSGTEIATYRYFFLPAKSRICGADSNGKTDVEGFLVRALKLTRQPLQAPLGDAKPVLAIPAGETRVLTYGRSGRFTATSLGQTGDSWIYLDKVSAQLKTNPRSASDAESLKTGNAGAIMSTISEREYDCEQKKYRVVNSWAWPQRFFGGDNLRLPNRTEEWIAPAAGTVGELLLNAVCSV